MGQSRTMRPMRPFVTLNFVLVFVLGLAAGQWVLKNRREWVSGVLPAALAPLATLGRWSLSFYMLHQPLLIGSVMGIIAALRQNRLADYAVIATATAGSTIPTFVIAPLFQLTFALSLRWFPVGGWGDGDLVHKVGPVLTLMLPQLAVVARLMRGSMIESLRSHHIRTARALGLSDYSIVIKHALRGALMPIISYAGPAAAALLTGSIIVESVFGIPGIGRYFVDAALNRDYTLVMGTVVIVALFTIVFNLIVDVLYAVVDPRVRYD